MAKLFETPPGVSTVDIRKRINGMLSEARKEAKKAEKLSAEGGEKVDRRRKKVTAKK